MLKAYYQMPIIWVPEALLHFLSLCAVNRPWLNGRNLLFYTIFLTTVSVMKNLAYYWSGMGIIPKNNRLHVLDPGIEVKIVKHLPY